MLGFMRFVFTAALMLVIGMLALDKAGEYLVIDQPIHADVIVVLAGDRNDRRFFRGLDLLHQGYAPHILVDANSDVILFGQTPAALQNDWIRRIGLNLDQARVCPTQGDSTDAEARSAAQCLHAGKIHAVLLVTSDYHTRRAISIFKYRVPGYVWSVAAARDDSVFNQKWWQRREWAKTALLEWTKLLWWQTVDRWRS